MSRALGAVRSVRGWREGPVFGRTCCCNVLDSVEEGGEKTAGTGYMAASNDSRPGLEGEVVLVLSHF